MNWIDVIFVGLMLYFLFRGWRTGIIQTLFRYLSVILGLIIAIAYRPWGFSLLKKGEFPLSDNGVETLAFVLLFLGTVMITLGVGIVLSKIIKPTPLGPVDKILGAVFSGVKVVALFTLFSLGLSFLPPGLVKSKTVSQSTTLNATHLYLPQLKKILFKDSTLTLQNFSWR